MEQQAFRNIPTWVGRSTAPCRAEDGGAEHPHVGGEKVMPVTVMVETAGTSPRGWGEEGGDVNDLGTQRNIPTWVGRSGTRSTASCGWAEHPHVGGEKDFLSAVPASEPGTSPRGWGEGLVETD